MRTSGCAFWRVMQALMAGCGAALADTCWRCAAVRRRRDWRARAAVWCSPCRSTITAQATSAVANAVWAALARILHPSQQSSSPNLSDAACARGGQWGRCCSVQGASGDTIEPITRHLLAAASFKRGACRMLLLLLH